jgi:hypothetical protein
VWIRITPLLSHIQKKNNMDTQIFQGVGKKIDISDLVHLFEAQEGDVEHIIGKTGHGKTYEATRRALQYLREGNIVYTTWRLNLPEYFDERESFGHLILKTIFFQKRFYRFDYKKNWHYVDLDEYLDKEGIFQTEKFARFLASRTDCIFFLDEGQDTFDSHQKAGKIARQSITRTRHMHKKLIIVSQRAQAVDVTARGNVTWFYKCESIQYPFLPKFFRVYITDEIDEGNNYPLWARHDSTGEETWKAPVFHSGFARKKIYHAYDSWYMRKQVVKSQELHLQGFELTSKEKLGIIWEKTGGIAIHKLSTYYNTKIKKRLDYRKGIEPKSQQSMASLRLLIGSGAVWKPLPVLHKKPQVVKYWYDKVKEKLFRRSIQKEVFQKTDEKVA